MAEYSIFSIEISKSYTVNEWWEDLRTVLKKAGAEGLPTVFLFTDSQLKDECFLEDINNILNTGEVPNLFPKDEMVSYVTLTCSRYSHRKTCTSHGQGHSHKMKCKLNPPYAYQYNLQDITECKDYGSC